MWITQKNHFFCFVCCFVLVAHLELFYLKIWTLQIWINFNQDLKALCFKIGLRFKTKSFKLEFKSTIILVNHLNVINATQEFLHQFCKPILNHKDRKFMSIPCAVKNCLAASQNCHLVVNKQHCYTNPDHIYGFPQSIFSLFDYLILGAFTLNCQHCFEGINQLIKCLHLFLDCSCRILPSD